MNGSILDVETDVSQNNMVSEEPQQSDTQSGAYNTESGVSDSDNNVSETSAPSIVYDEDLGGYPVVIVNDLTADYGVATLSLASGTEGYQVSDYWLNYFRGVLQKIGDVDYLVFATRDTGNGYNYVTHYYMYVGDIENGGEITVYDCYSENSIYYVDVTTETISAIDIDSYDTLAYSNLGHMPDIREGGGYVGETTLLFFLGFFAVYFVCRDFFDSVMRYKRKR